MNFFEKIVYMLQTEMEEAQAYGWFHLMCIAITIVAIVMLLRKKNDEKHLKNILGGYGIVALILEVAKQIVWSFNYDEITNVVTWDYQWYAAPFQLCTTPIFASIICVFLKDGKLRNALLSYMAFVTILGAFMTIIIPDDCLVSDILINIHTMWLHCGSFVVSMYLILSGTVKLEKGNLISAFKVFGIFVLMAEILNVGIYNTGILNGETFNMFYISPYFISSLPVFNTIQENVPFGLFLIIYILAICLGATIVYFISHITQNILKKQKNVLIKKCSSDTI